MSKPINNYSTGHAVGFSPREMNEEVDSNREAYKRQVNFWWDSLTPKQQREEWKKDNQLTFYVNKPKYLRK